VEEVTFTSQIRVKATKDHVMHAKKVTLIHLISGTYYHKI